MKRIILGVLICLLVLPMKVLAEEDTTYYEYETIRNNLIGELDLSKGYEVIANKTNYRYYAIVFNNTPSGAFVNNYFVLLWNNNSLAYSNLENEQEYSAYFEQQDITMIVCDTVCSNIEDTTNTIVFFSYGNYTIYDSNYNFTSTNNFELTGFYNDNIIIEIGDRIPLYKNLIEYQSWSDYESDYIGDYQEVNLDNYNYVILNLKNYDQKNAFDTNLQVKGQIGITPVYNYGQTSKDDITGIKVQDRCNTNYDNYTSYPLYVLNTDLQNNVVYIVKKCRNGSSFKFNRDIFDITYVTNANKDDPVITIDGKQYHTIPFENLPSSANQNEEENYIPGESGSMNDTGGIDGAIKGVQQKMGEIWDTITYFTGFINQMFSILPTELKTVLMSAFVIAITLGLIKIFIN